MLSIKPGTRHRAPSTLGTFLRTFTFGYVRQLDAVAARLLARLATVSPVLPGADVLAFVDVDVDVDVDDTVKATYGHAKQGAGYGYTGANALIATVSSPLAAPLSSPPGCARARPTAPGARPGWSSTPSGPPASPAPAALRAAD